MYQLWSQDNFSRGELSPYMYAKAQVAAYYNGLRTAQNVLSYPTGAAGKRFGTLFQNTLDSSITASTEIFSLRLSSGLTIASFKSLLRVEPFIFILKG